METGSAAGASASGSGERRYLHQLGKKLLTGNNSSQCWSLMDKTENAEIFEDMGVSLLEDAHPEQSMDDFNDPHQDRENHSPKLHRSLKRSHSKANLSPDLKNSPLKDAEKPTKSPLGNVSLNLNCNKKTFEVGEQSTLDSTVSPPKVPRLCPNKKLCSRENEPNVKLKESVIDNTSQAKKLSQDVSCEGVTHVGLDQISPMATYGDPSLSSRFISRHTDNEKEESKEYDVNFDRTVDEIDDLDDSKNINLNNDYYEENCKISNDIANLNKEIIRNEKERASMPLLEEKECFASHNLSQCEACDKNNTLVPITPATAEFEDGFSKLFDEIVLSIFQWLPKKMLVRCMLVCKRWNRLAMNSMLWSRVCLGGRRLNSGVLPHLMSRHPIVLRLANAQLISPVIVDESNLMEWRVQFLDMSAASISPECVGQILLRCPALLRLSLEGLAMSETACTALGKLSQLKVLNLALVTGLGVSGARAITNIPKLEALNVAWTGLDVTAVNVLCTGLPSSILRLNMSGFRRTLTEHTVETIVWKCPNLTELDVSDCPMLGEGLMPILQKLRKLEHLAVSRCNQLKFSDFQLLNNFQSLIWLDVFGLLHPITSLTLGHLNNLLPKIKLNQYLFSSIARPTVGTRRTSIWGLRTRD